MVDKAVATIEASEAILRILSILFLNKWFTKVSCVLCILLCWFCLSSIPLFKSYKSHPIPCVIVRRSSSTVMGLLVYAFRVRKTTCNTHCIFGTSNYKLWWIFSDLQFLGDIATDDDPSWAIDASATMKQRDRCKGWKESLEKRLMHWMQMNILMWCDVMWCDVMWCDVGATVFVLCMGIHVEIMRRALEIFW